MLLDNPDLSGAETRAAPGRGPQPALVTIIIPAHNAQAYLAGALHSALRQTYPQIEVLVIDDGSTDGTAAVAQSFAPRVRYLRQENAGPSTARNTGLLHARGEYVTFLDADDELEPERVAALMGALSQASSRAAFAISAAWLWDGARRYGRLQPSTGPAGERDLDRFLDDNTPYVGILARRQTLLHAGGFRADLWLHEDCNLWLRLLGQGHTYAYVPEPLYLYRVHDESLSQECRKQLAVACQVYAEALVALPLTWSQRRRTLYLLWRDRARLCSVAGDEARRERRLARWALCRLAGAGAQTARTLLRPHFTAARAWQRCAGRLSHRLFATPKQP